MTCPGEGKKPAYLQSSPAAEAAMDARHARLLHLWTKSKKPSSARKSGNWNRRAWPGRATCKSNRWCARRRKLDATILVLAGAARNIRSVTAQIRNRNHRRDAECAEKCLARSSRDPQRFIVRYSLFIAFQIFLGALGVSAVKRFLAACGAHETSSLWLCCACAASIQRT